MIAKKKSGRLWKGIMKTPYNHSKNKMKMPRAKKGRGAKKIKVWFGYLRISQAEYKVAKANNFYYESEGAVYDLLSPETEVIVWRGNYLDPVFHHFNREGKITREKIERINSKKQKQFAQ